jgi:hypothetical protein
VQRTLLLLLLNLALGASLASGTVFVRSYELLPADFALEQSLLHYTNLERRNAGLNELGADDALALAARQHAQEMATLQYISHDSPVRENATLDRRVARAGSAVRTIAENIARVHHHAEAGRDAVAGWMASPGHRENLMNPLFTHVGFGVAANTRGDLYVVQVLAYQPLEVMAGHVHQEVVDRRLVHVSFNLRETLEVLLGYRAENLPPQVFPAGSHTLVFPYEGSEPVHVALGVRAVSAGGGFIGQDNGWFDPRVSTWDAADSAPRQDLQVTSVASLPVREQLNQVTLLLRDAPRVPLGVWVNEEYQPSARLAGSHVQFTVPSTLHEPVISIGLASPEGGGQYRIVLEFTLASAAGGVRLHPLTAQD